MIIQALDHIKNSSMGGKLKMYNATEIRRVKGEIFAAFPLSRFWLWIVNTAFESTGFGTAPYFRAHALLGTAKQRCAAF